MPQINAQSVNFGAKAGLNLANIGGDANYDFISKTDFHLGLVSEISFSERFAIQPELLYSTQGAKMEESGTEFGMPYSLESKLSLDYINIPVLAKYYVIDGLSLEAGPQLGFLVIGEQEYDVSIGGENESGTEDVKDQLKSTDFGIAAGLGYKIDGGIFFNVRYGLGLSDIQKDGETIDEEFEGDFSSKNNVLQFSIGFMF